MTSAYVLAKDKLEQARALLASESWFDAQADHLIALAIMRMAELDRMAITGLMPPGHADEGGHERLLQMPWLQR